MIILIHVYDRNMYDNTIVNSKKIFENKKVYKKNNNSQIDPVFFGMIILRYI